MNKLVDESKDNTMHKQGHVPREQQEAAYATAYLFGADNPLINKRELVVHQS